MPVLLYVLAVAVFAQGTSEFILAGLLPGIAGDLNVSLGQAGLLTSAFALGMVIGAPVMAAVGRGLSPRWTLAGFLVLFIFTHVIGALTGGFGVLIACRIVAALANAGFLAVTLSTVTRLVPAERQARALSIILGGTTLALIVGVPAGAFVGSTLGWRAALWAIVAISLPALLVILVAAPDRPATDQPGAARTLGRELATLRQGPVRLNLALAVLVNAATFCTFTYLAVIATGPAGITEAAVPVLLGTFGAGAFLGVAVAGRYGDQHWHRLIGVSGPLLLLGWTLSTFTIASPAALWSLTFVQGVLSFTLGSTLIARIMATAKQASTMSGSFATVALNLGAIVGPVAGGAAFEAIGVRGPLVVSAVLVLAAVITWRCSLSAQGT